MAALISGMSLSVMAAAPDAKPADKAAKDAPKEIVIPKSHFEYDNKKGKDPFFPKSERWTPPPPKAPEVPTPGNPTIPVKPPEPVDPYKDFELKGMSGVGNNRLVVINAGTKGKNYLMGIGETKTIVTTTGTHRVKIESFSDHGVIIRIEGEKAPKELKLPTGP
jgi:hypothetical protein